MNRYIVCALALATMAASGKAGWDKLFEPKVPGFPKVPLNDIAAVERAIGPKTAAVMLDGNRQRLMSRCPPFCPG